MAARSCWQIWVRNEGRSTGCFRSGKVEIVCDTVDGAPMPPANFVTLDGDGTDLVHRLDKGRPARG